ncbi:alpha/beta hydrolase [Candidatus Thiothrix sp. Deng01]|uniref:Alpha/beta hydrolase n=1 Tax=Candidatus Thiothrix phosphatis TaxID=3112415 RepID=A0ABU6D2V8_9GAMM|nr:alpha/beta hydrolase [Candidatus Thiothrix sp. Deng01]MEB4593431.1 alpha/beta hydrolase [Candidatus Thiothrix sp. Deng01]
MLVDSPPATVVLLHGIWMRPLMLQSLASRLGAAGYAVKTPSYASVSCTPAQNAESLFRFIQTLSTDALHIVGHSLGGVVALHLLAQHPELPPGRLVTLGTPVQGSRVARVLQPLPGLGMAFGRSMTEGLSGDGVPTTLKREWGAVVGVAPFGLGAPFLWGEANDGAVRVCEAEHPAQTERTYLRLSHTALLFSAQAYGQVLSFLQTGHFSRQSTPASGG